MLKGLTSTFKEGCNNVELTYSEYVKLDNQTIPVKATLKDDSYENGNFIGTFILKEIQFETEATYEFRNKEFEYYKVVDGESIKIGTFISTDITINDTTEIVKVVGMDYGLKTQVEYTSSLDYASGEITLKDVWDECCTLSGLESGISDFANSDFIVDSDQFTGTGAMIRDVFKGIAMSSGSFVKVMNDDKVYLVFNEFTSEKEELEIDGSASADDVLKIDELTELDGNTTQSGTPTPDSPQPINVVSGRQEVKVNGKNLLPNNATTQTINNITYTINEDKTIKVNGTANGRADLYLYGGSSDNGEYLYIPKGNYTLNIQNITNGTMFYAFREKTAGTRYQTNTNNGVIELLAQQDCYFYGVMLAVENGRTITNMPIYPQLEKGNQATTYEEFKGQSYEINLGKNLLPPLDSGSQNGLTFTTTDNGITTISGTATSGVNYFKNVNEVLSAGTYTLSVNLSYTPPSNSSQIILQDINNNRLATINLWNITSKTFTLSADTEIKNYYFYSNSGIQHNGTISIQLEKGSQATSYSPYKTPIELCKIGTYQDRIYKENGTWYLHKEIGKVVLNGSETYTGVWWDSSVPRKGARVDISNALYPTDASQYLAILGDKYTSYSQELLYRDTTFSNYVATGICIRANNSQLIIKNNNLTLSSETASGVAQAVKEWVTTNGLTVYYPLATPTTTEITDTELISQLNSIELLEGLNNISITSNDLTGKLKLTYYNNELDIIEDYVELEDKRDTHPWTCLRLGMSNIEGENVDYIDEDLVAQYGENWLILNDNPFAYTQEKRQQLIMNIFNQIKAFGYSAFVSKVAFKPYLTSGDIIHFRNREKELVKSIVLRYTHSGEQITLEAPSETSATVNYIYPLNAIDIAKQTQIVVDKDSGRIDSLTAQTQTIQDDLRQNYYTLEQTNELVQNASTGLTNTFSEAGGNNIFRNTGLWFETTDNSNPYEFWNGVVAKQKEDRASNMNALLLQNGTLEQEQLVPNGIYTISFKYQKLVFASTISVSINDVVYELSATEETTFTQTIEVSSQHINIKFITNVNNSCEVYDLMVNAGAVSLAYSQNQNETTTDTVNISKGIEITSSDTDVRFKANADGIRTLDKSGNVLTNFTDTGMKTKEAIIEDKAQITGTLWQEVNGQTWITRL